MAILKNINFHHRRDCGCYLMVLVRLFYVTLFLAFVTDVHGERCALRAISGGANYTTGSKFESNLKRFFQNLVLHTPQTGFNTSVYGQIPNRIFGLFQCRGDTTVDQCYNCSKWVTSNITKFCGNSCGCRVWFDLCYLRYENYNFTGQMEDSGPCYYLTPNATNPAVSMAIVAQLWSKLKDEAASAMKRCAFGRTVDSLSRNYIYVQAQCTRDISTHYCKTCLSHAINYTKNYSLENYPGNQGLQGLFSNCVVRYETYRFFNLTPLPPSPAKAPAYYTPQPPSSPAKAPAYYTPQPPAYYTPQLPSSPAKAPAYCTPQPPPAQVHVPTMLIIAIILVVLGFQCLFGALRRLMPVIFVSLFAILRALMSAISVCLFPILRSLKSAAISICLFATWRRLKSDIFGRGYKGHGQVQEDALNIQDQSIGHRNVNEDVVTSQMEISLSATEIFHDQDEEVIIQDQAIVTFKMETLVAATKNFHDDNKLGEGGFGPVYKGITEDGTEIAVKKLSLTFRQGRKEFLNEVHLVAKIRHRNVVNILGCCAEGSERLLVYEYLPNRSLDKILLDRNKPLDWPKRYNVILGVARGLLYLHEDSHLRIIHRDIKASNILLDENMNPKIADFGLARLFPEDVTHVSTGAVAGTYGYMAPEYALRGQLSVKVDVYSFGVLLLELVTGRKNTDYDSSSEMQTLLGWAWASYQQQNIVQMFDPAILETCDEGQACRCIHVGLLCTQADPLLRPSMPAITLMLSPQFVGLPDPTKPAFVVSVNQNINSINSVDELSSGPTSI